MDARSGLPDRRDDRYTSHHLTGLRVQCTEFRFVRISVDGRRGGGGHHDNAPVGELPLTVVRATARPPARRSRRRSTTSGASSPTSSAACCPRRPDGWVADSRAAPNRWRSRVRDGAAASASIPPAWAAGHSAAADPCRSVAADARPGGPRLRVPSIDGTRGVPGGLPDRAPPSSTVRQPLLPAFDFERRDCRSGRGLSHLRPRHRVRPLVSPQSPGPGEANTAPRGAAACRLTSKQPECGRPSPPSSSLARRDDRQFDQLEGGRRRPTRPSATYRLSRLAYDRAIEAGAFEPGAKLELIDGNAGREGARSTREGYDRDAFGSAYSSLEDDIIDMLPSAATPAPRSPAGQPWSPPPTRRSSRPRRRGSSSTRSTRAP